MIPMHSALKYGTDINIAKSKGAYDQVSPLLADKSSLIIPWCLHHIIQTCTEHHDVWSA